MRTALAVSSAAALAATMARKKDSARRLHHEHGAQRESRTRPMQTSPVEAALVSRVAGMPDN
ncbi:MAG: hypothetical protein ABR508_12100 [Candidatus Baltobacteraceae bacterium]